MSRCVRTGDRFLSDPGTREIDTYTATVGKDGVVRLDATGKKDIYSEIQSHRDSVDIHVLLARYANGDLTALNKREGFYADVSEVPRSFAEVFQKLKDGEAEFYKLPLETRDKFGHSFERWLSTAGSEDWLEKMGVVSSDNSDVVVEPVDSDKNTEE